MRDTQTRTLERIRKRIGKGYLDQETKGKDDGKGADEAEHKAAMEKVRLCLVASRIADKFAEDAYEYGLNEYEKQKLIDEANDMARKAHEIIKEFGVLKKG